MRIILLFLPLFMLIILPFVLANPAPQAEITTDTTLIGDANVTQWNITGAVLDCQGATLTRESGTDYIIHLNNGAVVKNCIIDDSASYQTVTIDQSNVVFDNNTVIMNYDGHPFWIGAVSNVNITNNHLVQLYADTGFIGSSGSNNIRIIGNRLDGDGSNPIGIWGASYDYFIEDNYINGSRGIIFEEGSHDITIRNNTFVNYESGRAITFDENQNIHDVLIEDHYVSGTGQFIYATNASNIMIRDNIWQDANPNNFIMRFGDGNNLTVYNNTFNNLTFVNPGTDVRIIEFDGGNFNNVLVQDNYINNIVVKDYDTILSTTGNMVNFTIDGNYINNIWWPVWSDDTIHVLEITSQNNNTYITNNHISNVTNNNASNGGLIHMRNDNFNIVIDNNTFADCVWYSDDNFIWYDVLNLEGVGINVTNNIFEDFYMYGSDNYNNIINIHNAYNMLIDGNTFQRLYAPEGILNIGTADNIIVSNNIFTQFGDQGGSMFGTGSSSTYLLFKDNNWSYTNNSAMFCGNYILNMTGNRFNNLFIEQDINIFCLQPNDTITYNVFNDITYTSGQFFNLASGSNYWINYNNFSNIDFINGYQLLWDQADTTDVEFVGNRLINITGTSGVIHPNGDNYLIEDNLFQNFDGWALFFDKGDNYIVRENRFIDTGTIAMNSNSGDYLENYLFEDNLFQDIINDTYMGGALFFHNITWNKNNFSITRNCLDISGASHYCFWNGVRGFNSFTNNNFLTNGFNMSWSFPASVILFDTDLFEEVLVENNTGPFSIVPRLRYGSDMNLTVRNNNIVYNYFPEHSYYEYNAQEAFIYLYEYSGETDTVYNVLYEGNTFTSNGDSTMIYPRLISPDDNVLINGNTFNGDIVYIFRTANQENYITYSGNTLNNVNVNMIPFFDFNISSSHDFFSKADRIDLDARHIWGGNIAGITGDMNDLQIGNVVLLPANTNVNLLNLVLEAPILNNGTNNSFNVEGMTYVNITNYVEEDENQTPEFTGNTTNLAVNVNIQNVSLVLDNNQGTIEWEQPVNLTVNGNIDAIVEIGTNTIEVKTNLNPSMNKPARLTFKDLTYTNVDQFDVYKNGVICTSSECYDEEFVGNYYRLRVSSFSNFTLRNSFDMNTYLGVRDDLFVILGAFAFLVVMIGAAIVLMILTGSFDTTSTLSIILVAALGFALLMAVLMAILTNFVV